MSTTTNTAALLYHEPGIVTILILTSFLLLLNVVNYVVDRLIYVGLLGQIFLGIAWGTPGGQFLDQNTETVISNLGYLGLLLLVYEGGLTTSFESLKANLLLSSCVALTGIGVPIGLSFVMIVLAGASKLQAFAAGAALCSTSLGTTFTLLQTSGLNVTRLGVVLTSAAMMDDVVGLVMVQVISNLGGASSSFSATTVVRPVFVSVGFGLGTLLACRSIVLPMTKWAYNRRSSYSTGGFSRFMSREALAFFIHTAILIGMVTGATYAGTSNLFAAYLAGAAINWLDNDVPRVPAPKIDTKIQTESRVRNSQQSTQIQHEGVVDGGPTNSQSSDRASHEKLETPAENQKSLSAHNEFSGIAIFEKYYYQPLQRILKPFFFASIGFSIPISKMFQGSVVWRGIVYTLLMFIGKVVCGLWLIRHPLPGFLMKRMSSKATKTEVERNEATTSESIPPLHEQAAPSDRVTANTSAKLHPEPRASHSSSKPAQPTSIYPSLILGCAMVARGEIGFLISSLAQSNGIFGDEEATPIYLIVTWAIMLCTILGPVMVGIAMRRLNKLDRASGTTKKEKALGVWGIS